MTGNENENKNENKNEDGKTIYLQLQPSPYEQGKTILRPYKLADYDIMQDILLQAWLLDTTSKSVDHIWKEAYKAGVNLNNLFFDALNCLMQVWVREYDNAELVVRKKLEDPNFRKELLEHRKLKSFVKEFSEK